MRNKRTFFIGGVSSLQSLVNSKNQLMRKSIPYGVREEFKIALKDGLKKWKPCSVIRRYLFGQSRNHGAEQPVITKIHGPVVSIW